jgi:hypothetical protein
MAIDFLCPACGAALSMPDDAAGRTVRCGSCLSTLQVPPAGAATPPEPRPRPQYTPPPPPPPPRPDDDDSDEFGEPRRRAKRSGRGPLFWIVIVLFGLGLLTCLTCGGCTLMLARPHWHTYESEKGAFKADFPAPMNVNIAREAKLKLKANESVEGAMLVGRLELYWVWYADIDANLQPWANNEKIMDEAVKNLVKDSNGTIVSSTPKQIDGCPAREVVVTQGPNECYHCVVVVGKTKLYIAAVGGPFISPAGNPRVRRFLDSFHVIEDKNANPWRKK